MLKSTAGHTLEVKVGAYDTYQECSAATVVLHEQAYGWHSKPRTLDRPERLQAVYCKELKD